MKIDEAIKLLNKDTYSDKYIAIKRKKWANSKVYCPIKFSKDKKLYYVTEHANPKPHANSMLRQSFEPKYEDLVADDWEMVFNMDGWEIMDNQSITNVLKSYGLIGEFFDEGCYRVYKGKLYARDYSK